MDVLAFWGKSGVDEQYHPLLFHMLDVAKVTHHLLTSALPLRLQHKLIDFLKLSSRPDLAITEIAYLAGLHDIGKCIPGFQAKCPALTWTLPDDLTIPPGISTAVMHGVFSAREISDLAGDPASFVSIDAASADIFGRILGGHHGIFPGSEDITDIGPKALGHKAWQVARQQLASDLAQLLVELWSQWVLRHLTGLLKGRQFTSAVEQRSDQ